MSDLDEMIQAYRRHLLAAGRGVGTVKQRIFAIRALAGTYPDLLTVTTEDIEAYLALRRRSHAAETRKAMRTSFRVFFGWLVKSGRRDDDPSLALEPISVPTKLGRIAPDRMVQDALELATLPEKAMILLGRYAALRLMEITTLHTSQREGSTLRITGKGEKQANVPINDELLLILKRLEAVVGYGYYFPGRYGGHMHPQAVNKTITRRLGMNPHSLRHAALTAAYKGTHDIRAVQEFARHASLQTTQRYLHVDPGEVRAAADATAFGRPDLLDASPMERVAFDSGNQTGSSGLPLGGSGLEGAIP